MKLGRIVPITVFALLFTAAAMATDTPTDTPTPQPTFTETPTFTVTQTHTDTPTITPTSTITPTFTASPTPQKEVLAYPNPVAYTDTMGIAYPIKDGKTPLRTVIIIRGVNGDYAAQIVDDFPNGYTKFSADRFGRGTYFYTVEVRYTDGFIEKHKPKKFAVIK